MVNSINSANTIQNNQLASYKKEDIGKLVKYVNNQTIAEVPDTFSSSVKGSLTFASLFEGIPLIRLLKRNKKVYGKFVSDNMKSIDNATKETLKKISNGAGSFTDKVSNFIKTSKTAKEAYASEKTAVKAAKKLLKKEKALKTVKNAKKAEKLSAKIENLKTVLNSTSENAINTKNAINTIKTASENVKFLDKIKSGIKTSGAKSWFLFSLAIEGMTEIIPTFKELGFKKGIKQLAKSTIKTAGDTFGFIAGESIGTALGTAIGTALFPGVGTVIGAISGLVVGGIGSFVMGKITKKITGKSEREKAQEKQEQNTINEIANNQTALYELKTAAKTKLQEEAALNGGKLNENSKIALESLNNLESNPFTQTV